MKKTMVVTVEGETEQEGFDKLERALRGMFGEDGELVTSSEVKSPPPTAQLWIVGNRTSASSITMWCKLLGLSFVRGHSSRPLDEVDFGCCHHLVNHVVPEWRQRIGEMRDVARWWPFIDAWSELERLYEGGAFELLRARLRECEHVGREREDDHDS